MTDLTNLASRAEAAAGAELIERLMDALGYRERAAKGVALLRLIADEPTGAISADDPRLEPFCDDYYPTDTFNALCDIEWIEQIGSADFDDYRAVLLPNGAAALRALAAQEGKG